MRNLDEEPDYFISIIEDNRQNKETEEALRRNEAILRESQRLAKIGNWRWRIADDSHFWSPEISSHLWPRSRPAPRLSRGEKSTSPRRVARRRPGRRALPTGRATLAMRCRDHQRAGESAWVIARGAAPDAAPDGTIIELYGTVQDITERKLAEQRLLHNQQAALDTQRRARLAALNLMDDAISARCVPRPSAAPRAREAAAVDGSGRPHVGIWEWDMVSNRIFFSPECARLYGRSAQDLGDFAAWQACLHPDDRPRIEQLLAERAVSGAPVELEFRILLPDGNVRWLASKGSVYRDAQQRPVRLLGIHLDITERKLAEQQLRQLSLALEQSPTASSSRTPDHASSTSTPPSSPPAATRRAR